MNIQFSDAEKFWVSKQRLLRDTESSFFHTLKSMLSEVGQRLQNQGWKANVSDQCLQVHRPHWQTAWTGIHYEAFLDVNCLLDGRMHVGLHVERDTPHYRDVATRLFSYLEAHEGQLLKKYGSMSHGFRVPPHSLPLSESDYIHIIEGSICLAQLTSDRLNDALVRLTQTESFVDEALFLSNSQPVWRTDFSDQLRHPHIQWEEWKDHQGTGTEGGWVFSPDGGRFDSPCLKCLGKQSNYRDGTNILMLRKVGQLFHEFSNGQRVRACAAVHSAQGGELQFYAEAPKSGDFRQAFDGYCRLEPADRWQVVSWEGEVASREDYDFSKQGLYLFVIVKAPDAGLRIDSIEFGVGD